MLNLVHLKVLAAVARHGSVTKAARELQYSQPSVSHHLSRLEVATGTKLVQRVGRGIRLTPEGQLLASRATEIVGRVDAVAHAPWHARWAVGGHLTGCSCVSHSRHDRCPLLPDRAR